MRLRFVRYRFVKYRFIRYTLDLLDTIIPCKHFVCLQNTLKTSSRPVFETSSRHVLKTSWRRLQRNSFSFSNVLEDEKLLRWRRVEDVFKTCLEDVLKTNKCLLGIFWFFQTFLQITWMSTLHSNVSLRYILEVLDWVWDLSRFDSRHTTTMSVMSFWGFG